MCQTIALFDVGRMPDKSALLTGVTRMDEYRQDSTWRHLDDGWQHGRSVDAIQHAGKRHFSAGDVLQINNMLSQPVAQVMITTIEMIETKQMTDADAQALGYRDKAEYMAEGYMGDARGWLIRFVIVPSRTKTRLQ